MMHLSQVDSYPSDIHILALTHDAALVGPLCAPGHHTEKKVVPLFFEERAGTFTLREFRFRDPGD